MNTEDFLLALARRSLDASIVLLLVLATQRLFRKQLSPHWHCALWLLVIARLLPFSFSSEVSIFNFLNFGHAVSPFTHLEAPLEGGHPGSLPSTPTPVSVDQIDPALALASSAATAASRTHPFGDFRQTFADWPWMRVLFWVWASGALAFATYVASTSISLFRRLAGSRPLEDPGALADLHEACVQMKLARPPVVVESNAIATPALYGVFRPRLLLPQGFTAEFSREQLRFVFLHELAHLRRRDLPLNWLVTALQIVHWFNPLLWFGFARWRTDREIACDALAVERAGAGNNRAYGEAMLRLLDTVSMPRPRPCLVGILEDKRQLRRRMKMIATFTPARRPFVAIGVLAILAAVTLTDAQIAPRPAPEAVTTAPVATPEPVALPAPVPQPLAEYVLFLVNGAETMLSDLEATPGVSENPANHIERGRAYSSGSQTGTDEQKRASPKWQLTANTVEQLLTALPPETNFRVAVYLDQNVESIGERTDSSDRQAIAKTVARLRNVVPRGAANLESAFNYVNDVLHEQRPERIVLVTDGLPTTSRTLPLEGEITEKQRIESFTTATRRLPPRIPVHTILLPLPPGDPGAAGLYWELANATRGRLTIPAKPGSEPRTHLAFVIDTSGSMRDPNNGGLWPVVIETIEITLDTNPHLAGLQLIDGDGRFILGRKGSGSAAWLANTPEVRNQIKQVLRRYNQDTVSNPVPGIYNAVRFLHDKDAAGMRMGIYVLGDEFNSSDRASVVLERVDRLNPRDANGRRPITISAIGFPTTIRYQFSMGNTGLRFANLMRVLTYDHGGSFIALPEL